MRLKAGKLLDDHTRLATTIEAAGGVIVVASITSPPADDYSTISTGVQEFGKELWLLSAS